MSKPPSNRFCKTIAFYANIALLSNFCVWNAHAAAVTNLTDVPQRIEVQTAYAVEVIVIAPNETWRRFAKVIIRSHEGERRMGENEEFVIWQDGTFGPQRANTRGGRSF